MQFFDYDADLSLFNSLMEATEGAEDSAPDESAPAEEAPAEEAAPAEKTTKSKAKKGIPRTKLGSAIAGEIRKVLKTKEMNLKVFRATYWPNQSEPFELCTVDAYEVSNDPTMTQYVKQTDDTHITINFTALIRACTSDDLMVELEHISNWQKVASDTFGSYRAAVLLALDGQKGSRKFPSLATRINRGLKDVDSDKNTIVDPEEEKELKKQAREEKKAQKAQAEQNPQEEQQPQEQQNPQEEQQPQEQQNPQEEQKPQEQQNSQEEQKPQEQQNQQNNPETPSDDDPNAQFKKIRANYNENYKNDLKYYCEKNADDLDDEGKSALADQYYDKAMEDFQEVQDPEVQQKVQKMIQSDIELYSQPNKKNDSDSGNDKDNQNDFNWGQDDKDKKDGESEDDGDSDNTDNSGTSPANNNKGFFNWINNTMNNWDQNGVTNKTANPRPQGGVQRMDYTWKQSQRDRNGGKVKKKKTVDQQLDED